MAIKCENSFKVICGLICLEMGETHLRMYSKFRNRYARLPVTPATKMLIHDCHFLRNQVKSNLESDYMGKMVFLAGEDH